MRTPFNLPTVPASKFSVAQSPEIGVDTTRVRFAPYLPVLIGAVAFTAAATGAYTATGNAIPAGYHLVARVKNAALAGDLAAALTPIVITLSASLVGPITENIVATFTTPAWSAHQINTYPEFFTRDFIPATSTTLAALSVASLVSVAGGSAGGAVEIWAIPNVELFTEFGCVRAKNGGSPQAKIVSIRCGRNPSAHIKNGVRELVNLELTFPYKGAVEGLNRFVGTKGTIILDVDKDGVLNTQVEMFAGYTPAASTPRGDGDEEVISTFTSSYEEFFVGVAL
jgi:hypothetical protein